MSDSPNYEYLLGDSAREVERLRFQHSVWGPVTHRLFHRLHLQPGYRCLDVGAGPGLVSMDLREHVGERGEVIALEPSEFFRDWFHHQVLQRGWTNVHILPGTAYDAALPQSHFDLIFVRWVIGFVPSPEPFLAPLVRALRPGGLIAIQDYIHEGCALFPNGGPWDRFPELMRLWWRSGGGDPFVGASLPVVFRRMGLEVVDYTPTALTGGHDSHVMEWMGRYLYSQLPVMVERKLTTETEAAAIRADWEAHLANPDTVFVSPFVVDIAGRKPL